jgi:hypothetical protein
MARILAFWNSRVFSRGIAVAIEVQCTACGKQLRAPDEQAGRSGRCPSCKSPIVIPVLPHASRGTPGNVPAPSLEPVSHFPTQAAQAAAHRGFSPLASTMDEDLGLPPATNSDFRNLNSGVVAGDSEQIEPKHWFAVQISLKVTELALLVAWISCCILSLGAIGIMLSTPSSGFSPNDMTALQVMSVLILWGFVGMIFGWVALATGWIALLKSWPRDKKFLLGSLTSAGVAVFAILIVTSFHMLGVFSAPTRGPSSSPMGNSTAIIVLGSLASAASLISYGFYLANIQKLLGRDQISLQPIIYAAVVGTLTVLCLILNLAVTPSSRAMAWIIVLTNIITFVGEFLWLWLINAFASRDLRVSHAWKRL